MARLAVIKHTFKDQKNSTLIIMKVFFIPTLFCIIISQACNVSPVKYTSKNNFIQKQRCSFNMPASLSFQSIDTAKFEAEGYFKIGSVTSSSLMQIFIFENASDTADVVSRQKAALSKPTIFSPATITLDNIFGHYKGKGILMEGKYEGGIIKGKIKVFCFSDNAKSFLVIRQIIGSSEDDVTDFAEIEKSFKLR